MSRFGMLALGLLLLSSTAQAQAAEERAIREQLAAYATARVQGDGKAQAGFYTVDASFSGSDRITVRGRTEIAAHLNLPVDPNRRFTVTVSYIDFIKSDVALVDAEFGPTAAAPNGRVLYVLVKIDGTWLIHAARVNPYVASTPSK